MSEDDDDDDYQYVDSDVDSDGEIEIDAPIGRLVSYETQTIDEFEESVNKKISDFCEICPGIVSTI